MSGCFNWRQSLVNHGSHLSAAARFYQQLYPMFAAQTCQRGRCGPEDPARVVAICLNEGLSQLDSEAARPRRIFVMRKQKCQRCERRITVIAPMSNLFVIEAAKILGARVAQC